MPLTQAEPEEQPPQLIVPQPVSKLPHSLAWSVHVVFTLHKHLPFKQTS